MTSNKQPIVGVGAGGHAGMVVEIFAEHPDFEMRGWIDPVAALKTMIRGFPVLGSDDQWAKILETGIRHVFVGVGGAGDNRPRQRLFDALRVAGFKIPVAIHPSAWVSPSAQIDEGVVVGPRAIIGAGAIIGQNTIINSGAIVEHDSRVGDHVHLAPGVCLGGQVRIGSGAHVGLGARVIQSIEIGEWAVVGAGAVVLQNVAPGALAVGIPAKERTGA